MTRSKTPPRPLRSLREALRTGMGRSGWESGCLFGQPLSRPPPLRLRASAQVLPLPANKWFATNSNLGSSIVPPIPGPPPAEPEAVVRESLVPACRKADLFDQHRPVKPAWEVSPCRVGEGIGPALIERVSPQFPPLPRGNIGASLHRYRTPSRPHDREANPC